MTPVRWAGVLAASVLLSWAASKLLPGPLLRSGLGRTNYQGRLVPTACGLGVVAGAALPAGLASACWMRYPFHGALSLAVVAAFAALGLADDLWGDRTVGGLKGHLGLLLRGRVTTGALKALGGAGVAIAAGFLAPNRGPVDAVQTAILVALCANAINLLDTRPVRAAAAYVVGALLAAPWAVGRDTEAVFPMALAAATMAYASAERRRAAMLGDVGSNALGAALGLMLASCAGPAVRIACIAALVWLHIYTERHSLSALIDRNWLLHRVDAALRGSNGDS